MGHTTHLPASVHDASSRRLLLVSVAMRALSGKRGREGRRWQFVFASILKAFLLHIDLLTVDTCSSISTATCTV